MWRRMSNERLSLPVEGRRWAALTARALSAAASFTALVLLQMWGEGLRLRGRALRRAAASGSLWLESATMQDVVLSETMRRLFDYTALQQHRGMQTPEKRCSDWARDALAVT